MLWVDVVGWMVLRFVAFLGWREEDAKHHDARQTGLSVITDRQRIYRLFFFWLPAKKIGLVGPKAFGRLPSTFNSRDNSTMEERVDSVVNGRIKDRAFAKGLF